MRWLKWEKAPATKPDNLGPNGRREPTSASCLDLDMHAPTQHTLNTQDNKSTNLVELDDIILGKRL